MTRSELLESMAADAEIVAIFVGAFVLLCVLAVGVWIVFRLLKKLDGIVDFNNISPEKSDRRRQR